MPDIDHQIGKMRTMVMGLGLGIALFGFHDPMYFPVGVGIAAVGFIVPFLTVHRGSTHSLIAVVVFGVVVSWVTSYQVGIIGGVSYWSHLLLDKIPFKVPFKVR